jgi:YggT family protein
VITAATAFDATLAVLRIVFLALAAVLAVVSTLDWLVRTRRLSPFSPIARFCRRVVDPLFVPVEKRVVRAGGLPASAPWWTLAAVILAGILVLTLLGFLRGQVLYAMRAVSFGTRGVISLLVNWTFEVLQIALIVRVICSWVRISPYSRWVRWSFTLTEPMLRPLRSFIPLIGMFDITPIVAYFALRLLQGFILNLL